ncbi:YcxB family protein [Candidatus Parcubacteria bacterium]|nr:YcxB family protein [Candidatus Parcubacteria bacterium]
MEISYKLDEKDFVEYNMFHFKHSKTVKKLVNSKYFYSGFFLFLYLLISFFSDWEPAIMASYSTFLILALLFYFAWDKYYYRQMKKNVKKLISEDANNGLVGDQKMIISEEGIKTVNEYKKSETTWAGVNKLMENNNYFFIYIAAYQAYVVPKRCFNSKEDKDNFRNEIMKNLKT